MARACARFDPDGGAVIIALSRFTIANGMTEEVRTAFRDRPHLVDAAGGFLGMEVMSPFDKPAEIWLVTRRASASPGRNLSVR